MITLGKLQTGSKLYHKQYKGSLRIYLHCGPLYCSDLLRFGHFPVFSLFPLRLVGWPWLRSFPCCCDSGF